MKAYTDLEQAKKLAEILPIESADMGYIPSAEDDDGNTLYTADFKSEFIFDEDSCIHCWSLATLLDYLLINQGVIVKSLDGQWEVDCIVHVEYSQELVDACVEMILTLHEQKLI